MKKIEIKKLQYSELSTFQSQLEQYTQWLKQNLNAHNFYDAIISMDISLQMWYSLRGKLENPKAVYTLKLKPSEAIILTKCALWENPTRNPYEINAMQKCIMVLDQQLKSLNT